MFSTDNEHYFNNFETILPLNEPLIDFNGNNINNSHNNKFFTDLSFINNFPQPNPPPLLTPQPTLPLSELNLNDRPSTSDGLSHSNSTSTSYFSINNNNTAKFNSNNKVTKPKTNSNTNQNSNSNSNTNINANGQKKRPRRRHDEIDRVYNCSWNGCTKSYGTLNHLNAHVMMQKHGPKRLPHQFREIRQHQKNRKKEENIKKKLGEDNNKVNHLQLNLTSTNMKNIENFKPIPHSAPPTQTTFSQDIHPSPIDDFPNTFFPTFPNEGLALGPSPLSAPATSSSFISNSNLERQFENNNKNLTDMNINETISEALSLIDQKQLQQNQYATSSDSGDYSPLLNDIISNTSISHSANLNDNDNTNTFIDTSPFDTTAFDVATTPLDSTFSHTPFDLNDGF